MAAVKGTQAVKHIVKMLKDFEQFMKDNRRDFGSEGHTSFKDYKEVLEEWQYSNEEEIFHSDKFLLAVLKEYSNYEDSQK